MRLSMTQSCAMHQKQEQLQKMSFRLELRQELRLPSFGPSPFKEPDGHSQLITGGKLGNRYEVHSSDLEAFTSGIRIASAQLLRSCPHTVLVGVRGALPYAWAIKHVLDSDPILSKFVIGSSSYRTTDDSCFMPNFIPLKSSYFLKNLASELADSLSKAVINALKHPKKLIGEKSQLKLMLIETSVTGTKLEWYLPEIVQACDRASQKVSRPILLDVMVFKPTNSPRIQAPQGKHCNTRIHEILLPNLITEDVPALLMSRNSRHRINSKEVNPKARKHIHALEETADASVLVYGDSERFYSYDRYKDTYRCLQQAVQDMLGDTAEQRSKHSYVNFYPGRFDSRDKERLIFEDAVESLRELARDIENSKITRYITYSDSKEITQTINEFCDTFITIISKFKLEHQETQLAVKNLKNYLNNLLTDISGNILPYAQDPKQIITGLLRSTDLREKIETALLESLYTAFYEGRGSFFAIQRSIELDHTPHNPLASLACLIKIVDHYDVALVVGPEGYAYEPMLGDLGINKISVNIPEATPDGTRSVQKFRGESISKLKGRKVLIIEDDIRSGATLRALLPEILKYTKSLGLFLGSPAQYQELTNVPDAISTVHQTSGQLSLQDRASLLAYFNRQIQITETSQTSSQSARKSISPIQQSFIDKYKIRVISDSQVAFILPARTSRNDFLNDAREAIGQMNKRYNWNFECPKDFHVSRALQSRRTQYGHYATCRTKELSQPLRLAVEIDFSWKKPQSEMKQAGWCNLSLLDLGFAHIANYIATGKDLFKKNVVATRDMALYFDASSQELGIITIRDLKKLFKDKPKKLILPSRLIAFPESK